MNSSYHLVPESWYRSQPGDRAYVPEPFDADGFVHLTHGLEDVLAVGNMFYRDDPRPYLLLTIDLGQITSDDRYDDERRRFPQVDGPLDRPAIVTIQRVERAGNGDFTGVSALGDAGTATGR